MIKFSSRSLQFSAALLGGLAFNAAADVDVSQYAKLLPEGASVGFIAENINQQKIIADNNGATFMLPASTQMAKSPTAY